jgi:hypothetical protein
LVHYVSGFKPKSLERYFRASTLFSLLKFPGREGRGERGEVRGREVEGGNIFLPFCPCLYRSSQHDNCTISQVSQFVYLCFKLGLSKDFEGI